MLFRRRLGNGKLRRWRKGAIIAARAVRTETLATSERLRRARLSKASKRPTSQETPETDAAVAETAQSDRTTAKILWDGLISSCSGAKSLINGSLSTIAIVIVTALFWHSLGTPSISISEISVPKDSIEFGYTQEEVASELKSSILEIIQRAHSHKGAEEVVTKFESTDFTIPGVGLSLFTIEDTLRHLFPHAQYWQISGDITNNDNGYSMRLRVFEGLGNRVYVYNLAEKKGLHDLIVDAAQAVVAKIDPYILAASFLETDPGKAEDLADKIIDTYQQKKSVVAWAHVLRSNIYSNRHEFEKALREDEAALAIDGNMIAAHLAKSVDLFNIDMMNNCNNDRCADNSIRESELVLQLESIKCGRICKHWSR